LQGKCDIYEMVRKVEPYKIKRPEFSYTTNELGKMEEVIDEKRSIGEHDFEVVD